MKIAVLSQNPETLRQVREALAALEGVVQTFEAQPARLAALVEQERPDVLLVEAEGVVPDLRGVEAVTLQRPALGVILLAQRPTPELLLHAMRIGVREVLTAPLTAEALRQALGRIRSRSLRGLAPARGRIIALMACKGGSGATFLAANLAYALAAESERRVLLIDLNLHFGEALLYISDARPTSTVADIAHQIQRLDAHFLESSAVPILRNLAVVAAPETPDRIVGIKPEYIERLLEVAAGHYDFVVLDVSRNLDALLVKALDMADTVFPVLQATLPFIRDAKRVLGTLHSLGYDKDKIRLIVNRVEKRGEIGVQDVERTLGAAVFRTIPNSYAAVAAAINHGTPILRLAPRDPVAQALQGLTATMVEAPAKRPGAWLRGLFGRGSEAPGAPQLVQP